MDILLHIIAWIVCGGLVLGLILFILDMIVEALTGKSLTDRFAQEKEEEIVQDDLSYEELEQLKKAIDEELERRR